MKWSNPRRVKYKCKTHLMAKYIGIWWNEQWNDETLEWLSTSVKYIKWPSALAYDEMNNEMMKWTMKWWNPGRVK